MRITADDEASLEEAGIVSEQVKVHLQDQQMVTHKGKITDVQFFSSF